jgi:hypothetical protein
VQHASAQHHTHTCHCIAAAGCRQNPVTRAGNMGDCCLGSGCSAAVVPEVFL